MKNIFTIMNLSNIKEQLSCVFSRFPVGIIYIIIFGGLLLSVLHGDFTQTIENNLIKGIFSTVIGFFFSLGFYLYSESKEQSKLTKHLIQLFPIGYSVLFFIFFQNTFNDIEEIIFIILSLTGIIGFLFFAPYIKNIITGDGKQSVYYTYFYNISVIILTSCILGGILFALGAIGITAVHELFDLSGYFKNEIYGDWAILALGVITPIFALTKIPKKREFTNNYFNENIFFSFLVKYIAIPFIYIYFIILYLYSAKVLMNFSDWPKGEVSWMVILFSIFGYLIYVFSYIFEEKNNFIKTFRKYFPFVVIPQIFMLFYAIYLRINQYDITVNRYFVIVFGIWLLCISIYYALSKKKYLGNVTVLLTLFTVIISVGPWSVYQLPESRQLNRLKNNLIEANILQGNTIVALEKYEDIDKVLSKEIYGGIDYLCDFNNCEKIKNLFPVIYAKIEEKDKKQWEKNRAENIKRYQEAIITYENSDKERSEENKKVLKSTQKEIYKGPNVWEIKEGITTAIKVKSYYSDDEIPSKIFINLKRDEFFFPINIQGYSQILELHQSNYTNNSEMYGIIDISKKNISIFSNEILLDSINIEKQIEQLTHQYMIAKDEGFSKHDLTFEIKNNDHEYKLIFSNIDLINPEYTGVDDGYYYGNGYILIK